MPKKGQLTGFFINCECCGKEIYQTKTQYKRAKHHFCSNKCQKLFTHNITHEIRECKVCKNKFEVSKKSTKTFCCSKCQCEWQKTQVGELNKKTKRISVNCDNCNKEIKIIPSNKKRFKYHFCSNHCRTEWYSNVFSQDDDWKDESRKRAVKILEERKIDTNTKPQIIINSILDKLNIEYVNEFGFVYYAVDNYLTEHHLVIEVMGDFWHANPLKYQYDNLKNVQLKRIPKDKAKHTYINKHHNIEILYLWESDIINDIDKCEKLILFYINNNGNINNYHSFNYSCMNNTLKINENIIIPYQDAKHTINA